MRYSAFVRAAALALPAALLSTGAAWAQTQPQPSTMTDVAPLPAQDRTSVGAVILMDDPVLAQRQQMANVAARAPDTRTLGAGPVRQLQKALTQEEGQQQQQQPATPQVGTPK